VNFAAAELLDVRYKKECMNFSPADIANCNGRFSVEKKCI
jgi:hypothetical protein